MYTDTSTKNQGTGKLAQLDLLRAAGGDPILGKTLAATLADLSVSTLDRLRKDKLFPEPLKLSTRRVGWRLSTVQNWIASRSARTS
jgi:predicted DNA-binding transcriptional regulator AlpA